MWIIFDWDYCGVALSWFLLWSQRELLIFWRVFFYSSLARKKIQKICTCGWLSGLSRKSSVCARFSIILVLQVERILRIWLNNYRLVPVCSFVPVHQCCHECILTVTFVTYMYLKSVGTYDNTDFMQKTLSCSSIT